MKKVKPIQFLREKLDPKHYPILYKRAKKHPESLKRDLESLARMPGGSLLSAK